MLSGFLAILAGLMFGLVAMIFLVEAFGYIGQRLRQFHSIDKKGPTALPGAFNLRPTVSALARRYQVNRLARWI